MPTLHNPPQSRSFRRHLRRETTQPEDRLWYKLRAGRLQGLKFRRQHGIGRYVVDFYCAQKRLVIELDGDSHFESRQAEEKDIARQKYLEQCGIRVIRFTNDQIMKNMEGVLERILEVLDSPSPPPSP